MAAHAGDDDRDRDHQISHMLDSLASGAPILQ